MTPRLRPRRVRVHAESGWSSSRGSDYGQDRADAAEEAGGERVEPAGSRSNLLEERAGPVDPGAAEGAEQLLRAVGGEGGSVRSRLR